MLLVDIVAVSGGLVIGLIIGLFVLKPRKFDEGENLRKAEQAQSRAAEEALLLKSKTSERVKQTAQQFEEEQQEFAGQIDRMEKIFAAKLASHEKREARNREIGHAIATEEKLTRDLKSEIERLGKEGTERLLQKTGLTIETCRSQLEHEYEQRFLEDSEIRIQNKIQWIEENAVRDAKNTLSEAVYRYAAPTSVMHEQQNIVVARDEIKGRIVGRGAKNIAFFEELFGVDVIFNDEPNTIILSCFNLVQREVARCGLERLMREKMIDEGAISRIKPLAEQDVEKILHREGEAALKMLGLAGMPQDFIKLVGRLRFRTSYGQNIMSHCFEVAYFARLMASAIGADEKIALLGGFFHDIGKAIDQEVGGSHDVLSKEILEKYGFSWEITHAAWTHHHAIPQETIEARLVQAADAISASRPGARAESVERYLEKIKDLQAAALGFEGVKKAYAINAGRELRVIVEPEKIRDANLQTLAGDIAHQVQEKGGYPGRIKIVTIRQTRATNHTRK